jgi:DNA polymerase
MIYSIDFETRSHANLPDVGLDIYANDPTTEVLCIAYGTQPSDVTVNKPIKYNIGPRSGFSDTDCQKLLDHVANGGKIQAWNAIFEYGIWNCVCVPKYGWPPLKLEQVIDSMAIAAANNIPQSLDDAGSFMDSEHKKDAVGKRLIMKLSNPTSKGVFNEDPELMQQLFDYCKQDVRTEMSIVANLRPLTASEQDVWELTQRVNLRGVPVDPQELHNAVKAVNNAQELLDNELLFLTGCRPSERAKLLAWLNMNGADMADLTTKTVTAKLVDTNIKDAPKGSVASLIRRALELRQEGSQTSVAKYSKMMEIQREGKIRNTLVYHGASTGRWASRGGLNLQNIARPTLEDADIELTIPMVFESATGTMQQLSSLVRSAIVAPKGKTFVDVDFSSIENRVGVYLAGQKDKVELFRKGLDEYKVFASESLYSIGYDDVTKDQRQISKSAVLGCLFGQGAKGLVKYAEGMGVKMSDLQAKAAVDGYRSSYAKVKELWASCETAAILAAENPGNPFRAGSKITLKVSKNALWMQLPSGRLICWQRPELELLTTPWGQQKVGVTVHSQNTYTRQWSRNALIGSSIFQSAVQGTARDCLAVAALRLDKAGFEMINFVHDEILMLVKEENAEASLEEVMKLMNIPPA